MAAKLQKQTPIVDEDGCPTQYFLGWLLNQGSNTTVELPKLTTGGTTGALTFTNGLLTKVVQPT